jgi:protein-S-isoprenylcysteine O-methyltransferase Ste14
MATDDDKSGASVKFPPPIVFLLFTLLAYGFHYLHPIEISSMPNLLTIGAFITILGFVIIFIATHSFKRAQTNIEPWKPTVRIISSGIFAYSRNPIYVAFCIITVGIGLILNSFWVVSSFIPSIIVIFFIAIKREEVYLENKFGQEYLSYKENVRRWF